MRKARRTRGYRKHSRRSEDPAERTKFASFPFPPRYSSASRGSEHYKPFAQSAGHGGGSLEGLQSGTLAPLEGVCPSSAPAPLLFLLPCSLMPTSTNTPLFNPLPESETGLLLSASGFFSTSSRGGGTTGLVKDHKLLPAQLPYWLGYSHTTLDWCVRLAAGEGTC